MTESAATTFESGSAAFAAGVEKVGGQAATARLLKVSQPKIHRLLKAGKPIWAEAVEAFEAATGIPKWRLRPDLYGQPVDAAATPARIEAAR